MVELIAITSGAGELIAKNAQEVSTYIARVSNPGNQLNFDTGAKLLRYCVQHQHWSVFEHAYMTLEINTTRAIAAQILRHRSFTFQEFSQRYADPLELNLDIPDIRSQDTKNRQNSINNFSQYEKSRMQENIRDYFEDGKNLYKRLIAKGVAKECARFVLPMSTMTRIYMTGSCRSWIHYIQLRTGNGTQLEHQLIAKACQEIFNQQFPDVAIALGWTPL